MEKRIIANKETGKKELEVVLRQEIKAGDLEINREDTPEDIANKALKLYANNLKNQILEESLDGFHCNHALGYETAIEEAGNGKVRCKKCQITFELVEPKSSKDITENNYKDLLHTIITYSGIYGNKYAVSSCYNYLKKDFDHIDIEDIFLLYCSTVEQYKSLSNMISRIPYGAKAYGYGNFIPGYNPLYGSPFDNNIGYNHNDLVAKNKPFGTVRPSIPLDYPDKDINLGNTRDLKNE